MRKLSLVWIRLIEFFGLFNEKGDEFVFIFFFDFGWIGVQFRCIIIELSMFSLVSIVCFVCIGMGMMVELVVISCLVVSVRLYLCNLLVSQVSVMCGLFSIWVLLLVCCLLFLMVVEVVSVVRFRLCQLMLVGVFSMN